MKNIAAALFIALSFSVNAQEKVIKPTDLPQDALNFVQKYYKDVVVKKAVKDVDSDTKKVTYDVVLENKTEIEFKETGSWKEIDGKGQIIPIGIIPQPFVEYVAKNYPKAEFTKIEKGNPEIDITLSTGVKLVFDIHGKFVKVDK